MKDALGHGSEAHHMAGVNTIGQPLRSGQTLAGKFTISDKDPATMTNGELLKEYERVSLHGSAVGRELIDAGRGMEKISETRAATDALALKSNALATRQQALQAEHAYRSKMGGRRVDTGDGRSKFVGKVPPSLKHGYYSGT